MEFKSVFVAVTVAAALILGALIISSQRPSRDTNRADAASTRATGKCAECHRRETSAVVHQFERSKHAAQGVTCYGCHKVRPKQEKVEHHGFVLAKEVTSLNCQQCHPTEYDQFVRSRHALPAWAAVRGSAGIDPALVAEAEKYHPGAVERPHNKLVLLEGASAMKVGCLGCHDVGKPNRDGSIGSCTQCHSRHSASIALARHPQTCGQCHMGPDHSQLEIYNESKHGALFAAQKHQMNLAAAPKKLTTADMPIPTCATCHMSGLEGQKVTHDVTERLSYWLFAPVSKKRPGYQQGQTQMKETCLKCHAKKQVEAFYTDAEGVVRATNAKVSEGKALMDQLRKEGLLTPQPFDEPIEFLYFDYWHYYGRTAKHGAFMGGADFVQWHGNYELTKMMVEMKEMAAHLRAKKAKAGGH